VRRISGTEAVGCSRRISSRRHKGKVERAIRYLRDRFLAGRTITSIDQGNRLLAQFIAEIAHVRPHPTIAQRTVGEVFTVERARPLALPETARVEPIKVDSQAFIHLDTNRYSVPSDYASRIVTLVVDDRTVRLVDGDKAIADHPRSWGRRQVFEKPEHRAALLDERRAARNLKGRDRLRAVVPAFDRIVERWDLAGSSLGYRVARAIKLLDLYGDQVGPPTVNSPAVAPGTPLGKIRQAGQFLKETLATQQETCQK
jgi:hypothetical protein